MAPKQQNTNEELDFAELMGSQVRRHHHDRADLHQTGAPTPAKIYRREAATRENETFSDGLSDRLRTLVDSEEQLAFAVPGVQQRLLQRMKQGHLPWEAGLDLHGYTIDEARNQLSRFIRDAHRQQLRCVIVVHGKASNADGRQPLLKSYVNDWLRQLPAVLAFISAQPKDGGNGALYVLLKRERSA